MLVLVLTSYTIGYIIFVYGALRASRTIHRDLVTSVLGTTLRWLDKTPTSRIITRCTQDIQAGMVLLPMLTTMILSILQSTAPLRSNSAGSST